jgi:hypothetical protein
MFVQEVFPLFDLPMRLLPRACAGAGFDLAEQPEFASTTASLAALARADDTRNAEVLWRRDEPGISICVAPEHGDRARTS